MSTSGGDGPRDAAAKRAEGPTDVVVVGGRSDDGRGHKVLRLRGDRVEAGELREAKEGKPIVGELVKLTPRPDHERVFDVETLARGADAPTPAAPAGGRPALVNSDAYRSGWDAIFGADHELPN